MGQKGSFVVTCPMNEFEISPNHRFNHYFCCFQFS